MGNSCFERVGFSHQFLLGEHGSIFQGKVRKVKPMFVQLCT